MTNSSLVGAPAHRNVPHSQNRYRAEVAVDLAALAGLELDEWQRDVFLAACGVRDDDRWAASEVGVIVPRQNGKGSLLEVRELAGLFVFEEPLILHSAHEFKTASEAFLRVHSLIDGCSDLSKKVRRVYTAHGQEGIELLSGQRLKFIARSKGSGRGFSGDCVILDEAYNLSEKAMAALLPTLSARRNPQIWYTSSAPLRTEESDVLRRLCRRGRDGTERLAYIEYCAEKGSDLDDPDVWATANPGFGIRVNREFIEAERAMLSDEDFERERLGIWREDDDRLRVISETDWQACEDARSVALPPLFFAVDVGPDRATASIGVAGIRSDGRVHVELIETRPGVSWLIDRVPALLRTHGADQVTLCPTSPAGSLMNDLGLAGVTVNPCTAQQSTQACGAFFDGIMERRYLHLGQPVLAYAVDVAEKRTSGDAWVWDRRSSAADITPLVSVTLAAWALHQNPPEPERKVFTAWR